MLCAENRSTACSRKRRRVPCFCVHRASIWTIYHHWREFSDTLGHIHGVRFLGPTGRCLFHTGLSQRVQLGQWCRSGWSWGWDWRPSTITWTTWMVIPFLASAWGQCRQWWWWWSSANYCPTCRAATNSLLAYRAATNSHPGSRKVDWLLHLWRQCRQRIPSSTSNCIRADEVHAYVSVICSNGLH